MLVYGKNVFNELSNKPGNIRKVYLAYNFKDEKIMSVIKTNKITFLSMDPSKMDHLVEGNHQGIIIEINDYSYYPLEKVINDDFIVILDHLEDPHNLGAIIRTCESAGVKSIIIPKDRSVQVNGTVMKISSGALEYIKVCQVNNIVNAIKILKDNGYFVYGADMIGVNYRKVSYSNRKVLVIGNEGTGLSKLVKDNCDEIIKIDMAGNINSLNASVAAGILIYGMKD